VKAQVFEAIVHDVRMRLRDVLARMPQPRASIKDRRTRQSSPESDDRTGWDGHKRRKGSKVHIAVDTLGQLLAVLVTPANAQECAQIGELAEQVQAVTGESVEIGFVDQGYTGEQVAEQAAAHGILRWDRRRGECPTTYPCWQSSDNQQAGESTSLFSPQDLFSTGWTIFERHLTVRL
jgi:hypothetical protein